MKHIMKLQPKYYNYILHGTKRIEIRLNDLKRQKIKVGDIITFKNVSNLENSFDVKVIELFKYNSFKDLINNFDISIIANNSMNKDDVIIDLEKYYPPSKQSKYGVLGIKFKLL